MKLRDKTITVTLGEDLYVKAPHVFQYDYGLMLVLDGVQLPADYEVHFSNKKHGVAKKAEVTENGVKIPDEYLRSGEDLFAWVYLRNGDEDGYTVYSIQFPVIGRSVEQGDNISTVEHNVIDKAIEALEEAVEETNQNVRNYPYINEDKYWMVYDAEHERFVNTGVKADGTSGFDLRIGTVTTLAPGSDATAGITWEDNTAFLSLGIPAGDASAMVSIHDERTNQATVTVHDAADNMAVDQLLIGIYPIQSGSGEAGPRNIRNISGVTGFVFTHTAGESTTEYDVSFEDEAGIVYQGVFNPLTGELVVDHALVTKRCVDMNNSGMQPGWRNSGIRELVGANVSRVFTNKVLNIGTSYGVDTTGDNDILYLGYDQYGMRQSEWINTEIIVQACVELAVPIVYNLDPFVPVVSLGDNTFSVNTGKIAYLKYPCDTKMYVDHKIAEVQAMVLEH